jgi:hypothetical protein
VDAPATDQVTVTIGVQHGAVSAIASGASTVTGSGGLITIQGSVGDVNATLETLAYVRSQGYLGDDKVSLSVVSSGYSTTNEIALTAQAYAGPQLSVPGGQVVGDSASIAFSAADDDAIDVVASAGETLSVTLSASHGSLSAQGAGAASISMNGSTLTVNGDAVDVDNTLATLVYREGPNFNGMDQIRVSVSDGTFISANSINLIAETTGPGETLPTSQMIDGSGSVTFNSSNSNAITVADASSGDITTTLVVQHGTLTVAATQKLQYNPAVRLSL